VLADKIKQFLVQWHDENGQLFDMFFANPDFQSLMLGYLAGTYDEFREEAG
jgi:type I restriction enzyme R subunit